MNEILLGIVSVIYLFVAINYFRAGNIGLGICFVAYAAANVGIYIAGSI
jgi:hypothetical protein